MNRRTQTVYVSVDSFLSPRGKVLHHFDQFLEGLSDAQIPCVWMTGWTRAQLDEPRRRLGQNDPFIGEHGSGVYLPEDYFHLKGSKTIRLGRYTCIPVAKPQPAAAAALEELASDLGIEVVSLRGLSPRELSQNTGLPAKEAEMLRMRDFDEPFFFAGAKETEIEAFCREAKTRGLVLQRAGAFWSLSCGANLRKCVRELGGLYDRALRAHALRIGLRVAANNGRNAEKPEPEVWPASAFDRTYVVAEQTQGSFAPGNLPEDIAGGDEVSGTKREPAETGPTKRAHVAQKEQFVLRSPEVWDDLLRAISR